MKLLLFNPETEYALASGASFYTPPASVVKLRKDLQLLPEACADKDDMILVDDAAGFTSGHTLVQWDMLEQVFRENPGLEVEPWGWNPALLRRLIDCGVPSEVLPEASYVALVRKLAHRRTTIRLNSLWNDSVAPHWHVNVPVELFTEDDCMDFYRFNSGCWLKAPWSSSGRGVINTAADMTEELVRQWCHGIIRRQGSVMGETAAVRVGDYATEWNMDGGEAHYLGLSSFVTSNRGKYLSNRRESQDELRRRFDEMSALPLEYVAERQKNILENTLAGYRGPLGVDMIVEKGGTVRPFVEVNLRRTMGMLYIYE